MSELLLFSDSSVNPQTQVGYGAYLVMTGPDPDGDELPSNVKLRRFEQSSSTTLELQTLLWALAEIELPGSKLKVYTDSQNIIGLPGRRTHLELNVYRSKQGDLLSNHELYREFYRLSSQIDCEFIKVRGHQPSRQNGDIERLFTLVDRASRKALREEFR